MSELAYINGKIGAIEDATVPVRDRGFIFGDGVYDVARVYDGAPFRLNVHVERLRRNAAEIEFGEVPEAAELREVVDELLERSGLRDAMVYMQLTRGVARRTSAYPEGVDPTLYVSVEEVRRGSDALRGEGAAAIVVEDIRWARNDIKTINLLPKVMMGERAKQAGAYEALYRGRDGFVWEGTSTNLFAVRDGRLLTPPQGPRVLPGTTRADVLTLAEGADVDAVECRLTLDDLLGADELFVTGTLTEVLGIVAVDDTPIGDGAVGPVTRRLERAYREHTGRSG
ncbi:MAG: aminotransferase class IV [Myxococcota bacterium]